VSFATRTNAEECNNATITPLLERLYAAGNALGDPGEVTPEQKEFADSAIEAAINLLDRIPLESR
jgi:hypothetical protein